MLTKKEKLLVSKLLELAGNQFSNHGCNDCPDEWFDDWSDEERKNLDGKINDILYGDDDYIITGIFGDDTLMSYFSEILKGEIIC